jgi:Zn-dependent protease with chaperone function
VLADRSLLRQVADAAGHGGARRRLRGGWRRHWTVALASAVAGLAACALGIDQAPRLLAPLVPQALADKLGAGVEAALTTGGAGRRCSSADGQRALDQLAARLGTAAVGLDRTPSVGVIDGATVNAFALPGRRILVMRGLIDAAEDGDELAGVLAHEMGHIAHRDPMKSLLRAAGLSAVAAALGLGDGGVASSASLARAVATAAYGRAAETQADAAAIETLRRADLRADGLGRFFRLLERHEAEPGGSGQPLTWLSDHPLTAEREARVAQPSDGAPAMTGAEWSALRRICRGG